MCLNMVAISYTWASACIKARAFDEVGDGIGRTVLESVTAGFCTGHHIKTLQVIRVAKPDLVVAPAQSVPIWLDKGWYVQASNSEDWRHIQHTRDKLEQV